VRSQQGQAIAAFVTIKAGRTPTEELKKEVRECPLDIDLILL
jgi:acyl-coenzyme A synthetase/AMP-(fatty) acid ligase